MLQKLAQWDPYEIWIEIRFFCRHFLVMHRSLVACSDLNYRGEAGLDFAADIHALVASDDAEVHGASVDGVRADVQGTFAPEGIRERMYSVARWFGCSSNTWNVPTLTLKNSRPNCLHGLRSKQSLPRLKTSPSQ